MHRAESSEELYAMRNGAVPGALLRVDRDGDRRERDVALARGSRRVARAISAETGHAGGGWRPAGIGGRSPGRGTLTPIVRRSGERSRGPHGTFALRRKIHFS